MGRDIREARIRASVSRQNSDRDKWDDQAWDLFFQELENLVSRPEFRRIGLEIT